MDPLTADDPRVIDGFVLMNRIGSGGMGVVYLGRRPGDGPVAAIKLIRAELLADAGMRSRFNHEVRAARTVRSEYVAPLLDAGYSAGRAYLAVEYIQGPTLREAVQRDGPLGAEALLRLAAGLADALVAIHGAGMVHRDLTPRNVLLTHSGPRIIDFGIARLDDATRTSTGPLIGTPGYVAPERLLRSETVPATDVFSLGALLLFAATGRPPFGSGSPMEVNYRAVHEAPDLTGVPDEAVGVIRACLAFEPAQRPTAAQIKAMVAGGAMPVGPAPTAVEVPPTEQPRSARRTLVLALAALVLLAGGAAAAIHFGLFRSAPVTGGAHGTGTVTAGDTVSPAATTGSTIAAGTYPVGKIVYDAGGLRITLVSMEVGDGGSVRANLEYRNTSSSLESLACLTQLDPTIDVLSGANGTAYPADASYCSDQPWSVILLQPGKTQSSYATFTLPSTAVGPFTLTWQDGDIYSGTVEGIALHR